MKPTTTTTHPKEPVCSMFECCQYREVSLCNCVCVHRIEMPESIRHLLVVQLELVFPHKKTGECMCATSRLQRNVAVVKSVMMSPAHMHIDTKINTICQSEHKIEQKHS